MQFTQTLLRLSLILLLPAAAAAQTTYLQQGDKQNTFLERLEIKAQTDSVLNFSKNRAYSRKYNVAGVNSYLAKYGEAGLSAVDKYNLRSFYMNNTEWLTDEEREQYKSKKSIWNTFYKTPANFYEVHVKDFDMVVNPILQLTLSKQNDNNQRLFQNTRGLSIRGKIANKIGFTAMVTENQERPPSYVQQFITDRSAVPGAGYYKEFKAPGGVDYFDARGYFTFNATKYIDVSFGYDKHFIGNGHRSLFLSDFGNNNLFLKLNTRIWKFNYQNIFMELNNAYQRGGDRLLGKKYAAVHHLDINVTKWLNVGLFEGVVFGRENRFEFGYLNPVIFYRSIEQQNGSEDNALAGLDLKANIAKSVQLYGQLLLDEFKLKELTSNSGWWANKWGIQAGVKYIDAFTIKNLDLQVEYNRVRPFTYSHRDSVANYTHYNQPMAHPLMANFSEVIGILRYQPIPKLMITGKLIAYTQGRDSSAASYGSNIFLPSRPPYLVGEYGYNVGSGWKTNVIYGSLLASYELFQNMFIDASLVLRRLETTTPPVMTDNTSIFTIGFRWNMMRREFDF
ncbi:capsule assembly Wzi family protein [Terrimonas rubra]|uniref:Capsule assembly Wzi family protein n=1 Tax=Terrimonas rubra TaxID=1035890 RepID=A0ABW6A996_9BACT